MIEVLHISEKELGGGRKRASRQEGSEVLKLCILLKTFINYQHIHCYCTCIMKEVIIQFSSVIFDFDSFFDWPVDMQIYLHFIRNARLKSIRSSE